jgi:hypothetical protein
VNRRAGAHDCASTHSPPLKDDSTGADMRARGHNYAARQDGAWSYVDVVADHTIMIDRCQGVHQHVLAQSRRRLNDSARHHLSAVPQVRGPGDHGAGVDYSDKLISKRGKSLEHLRSSTCRIDRANSVGEPHGLRLPGKNEIVGAQVWDTQNVGHWRQAGHSFHVQSSALQRIDHYPRVTARSNDYNRR